MPRPWWWIGQDNNYCLVRGGEFSRANLAGRQREAGRDASRQAGTEAGRLRDEEAGRQEGRPTGKQTGARQH